MLYYKHQLFSVLDARHLFLVLTYIWFFIQAELRFLLSKPSCFIVIGKPGAGKTVLARRLAQEWKCELVNGKVI